MLLPVLVLRTQVGRCDLYSLRSTGPRTAHITSATTAQANVATEETPPSEIPLRTVHINSIDTVPLSGMCRHRLSLSLS